MKKITDLKRYENFLRTPGVHVQTFLIDERNMIFSVWIDFEYDHKVALTV